ncbi:MAG: ribonuclease E inhibitor RraB [Planctomycetota bacterium]|nr:ribonuclease E inhibitor RraB [Planctomycetota bacterium]
MAIIERAMLEEMFDGMRTKSKWNVDGDLLWGYFFTDKSVANLRKAAKQLASMGYRFVETHKDANGELFWLHVEKVETHTVDSLDRRNHELSAFAEANGLNSYDGMDVGDVKPPD